ncbi:methionine ABC transporter permease [Furfurilactobacillus siliginis]|uniref:ABC-type metal ion transport system, permease component n=1 Tax=Furfurilactobacillus siliginis TaxID=348151 RepID=A0A0R2L380_9LACO|nr:methionine ABC transporter permease [Furfurilactobacillus siliginis]KRN96147.1 ABC-type metal ion transport system, permease component [Furfurilactobacillus siliginis]GEK27929.1 D-methionine ABC transporter permease [Furfurilactobacillus siliginis]
MTTILASDFWSSIMPNVVENKDVFIQSTWETIYMTLVSGLVAGILGMLIGVVLVVTAPGGILENKPTYWILDKLVNIFRSIPFIILLAVIAPFTRLVVGTSIGTTAALVPLTIGCAPFYARQVQNALVDVDRGIIEAAQAVGASPLQIIFRVYLREALPDLIRTSVVTIISLIGLTAMAGAIGGGGLGNTAISIGYNRFENDITIMAMIIILAIVFVVQVLGDLWARRTDHR